MGLEVQTEALAEAVIVSQLGPQAQAHGHDQHASCANCGATLTGPYCHNCGQAAHVHKSLLHLVEEFLHGFFHFETKAWRTIPALIFKPGTLTRNYIEGQRVRYVSPLALFLFLIFLMFFSWSLGSKVQTSTSPESAVQIQQKIDATLTRIQKKQNDIAREQDPEDKQSFQQDLSKLQNRLAEMQQRLAQINQKNLQQAQLQQAGTATETELKRNDTAPQNSQIRWAGGTKESGSELTLARVFHKIKEKRDSGDIVFSSVPFFDQRMRSVFDHDDFNPELAAYKLKSSASKYAFILLPVSLPFIWVLFVFRRRFGLFDHAVFALYSFSFMAVLSIAVKALSYLEWDTLMGFLIALAPPVHMYAQLKGCYELSRFAALWRTLVLLFVAMLVMACYFLFLFLYGI